MSDRLESAKIIEDFIFLTSLNQFEHEINCKAIATFKAIALC
jgi:hypothetical protein